MKPRHQSFHGEPAMSPFLKTEFDRLRSQVAERNRLHVLKQGADARATFARSPRPLERSWSLDQQLLDMTRTLPAQLLDRPWSMAELVMRLRGKYRDRPHAQQVGDALRRLGWRRVRLWGVGAEGRRVWLPRLPRY